MKRRRDGRLQLSFTVRNPLTGEARRLYAYGYTEEEVLEERRRKEREAREALSYCGGGTPFARWCDECLRAKLADDAINEVTYESYAAVIARHVLPSLPQGIRLAEVGPAHVKALLQRIEGLRTREYTYTVLNTVFSEAVFESLIADNPCRHVRKPRAEAVHAAYITPEDFRRLMAAVRGSVYYYAFLLAFYTGCRRGEICALRWSDFKGRSLQVARALKETKGRGLHEGEAKSRSSVRTLPLSEEAAAFLEEWRAKSWAERLAAGLPWDEDGYILHASGRPEAPMAPSALTTCMKRLRKRLGLPPRTCMHSFRHTHATNLAAEGITAKKLQARMGHASAAFTLDTYVRNTAELQQGIESLMEGIEGRYKEGRGGGPGGGRSL